MYLGAISPPTKFGPLSYGNHTVTVNATNVINSETTIQITHQGKKLLTGCTY